MNDETPVYSSTFNYLTPIGYTTSAVCGYCKTTHSSYSYYAQTSSMSPEFYQEIADRSWRRSGSLLYRPDPHRSCCPHYTVRLDSTSYKPTRNQRQALNKFNKHIIGDEYIKAAARLYPLSREEARRRDTHFDLISRVHEAEYCNLKSPPKPAHKFTVTLEDDSYTDEKFALYQHYQRTVHKEEEESITKRGFSRFLCNSPLRRGKFETKDGTERDIGSFHQCYRIDGRLVAVGILDLLPHCVSSVYFMYDESLFKFSPGKLSAMMEISLAIERGYKWWYAGFYIHSSSKMKYKMDFSPQYILDPSVYEYIEVDKAILSLLDRPYCDLKAAHKQWQDNLHAGVDNSTFVFQNDTGENDNDEDCEDDEDVYMTSDDDEDNTDGDDHPSSGNDSEKSKKRPHRPQNIFLLNTRMPGIPTIDGMRNVNLDKIPLRIRSSGHTIHTGDISYWRTKSFDEFPGLKASIAELVAALGGQEIIKQVCLEFMR
ncbi:hypothetical protein BROUX41_000364 [Berkeleyomyces rouxiae]|uniref:uncharacterized protein n=1 Tax=Berkeleyomyces rouxiae TaxID=2035830 RepID=UPI003B7D0C79